MEALGASVLDVLVRTSLQGAIAIAAVWIVCRLFPRLPGSVRCGLWWLACAKLALGLVWTAPVRLALLPAAEPAAAVTASSAGVPSDLLVSRPAPVEKIEGSTRAVPWKTAVLAAWGGGVLLLLGLTVRQHWLAVDIVRRADPVDEPWLAHLFHDLRDQTGAPRRTDVRLSPEVQTPQVSGLVRPVVLLPDSAPGRLSRTEMAMALCHELLHVRRGDLWLGWVPALVQRIFFFHPLVHLAAREYSLAREAACDAAVLRVLDPGPETYGHLLIRLGVTPRPPKLAAAGAAPSYQILKRRLTMLQNASDKKRLHPAWWALVALSAVLMLTPFIITAQESPGGGEDSYVLLLGKDTTVMGGSPPSLSKARKLQKREDEQLFWFRHGGRDYVIRDSATLQQIKALFAPQIELGEQQAELGVEMTRLNDQQAVEQRAEGEEDSQVDEKKIYIYEEKRVDRDDEAQAQEPQDELSRQQEELGNRQEEMIQQAETQLRAVVGAALANGKAQEVR